MIYKIIKNSLLFNFTIVLIFASSGFSLNKMICPSGNVSLSFLRIDNCEDFEFAAQTSISEKCCDFLIEFIKLNQFVNAINFIPSFLLFALSFVAIFQPAFFLLAALFGLKLNWPPPNFHKRFFLKTTTSYLSCFII